jgi:hypothetical protein
VTLIDITALARGNGSGANASSSRLAKEEIDRALAQIDREHESKQWRSHRDDLVASVIMAFGGGTANVALRAARFFVEQAQSAADGSTMREIGQRMFYFSLAFAAIALDYVAAKSAFQPVEQRKSALEDVLRFGTDPDETKKRLALALQLVRGYLPNGTAVANKLRSRIEDETKVMPVDIIADVVVKMAGKGHLFEAGRVLERAAHEETLPKLADLSVEARAFAGAFFDYSGIDRVKMGSVFAGAVPAPGTAGAPKSAPETLFDDNKS